MDELSGRVGPYTWRADPEHPREFVVGRDNSSHTSTRTMNGMDIGEEKETLVVEPAESPLPKEVPAPPEPAPTPSQPATEPIPAEEPVPA